jgi:hypothetical protein
VLELVDRANLSFADASRKGSSPFSDIWQKKYTIILSNAVFKLRHIKFSLSSETQYLNSKTLLTKAEHRTQ